jgi:hypothetical protein
MNRSFAQGLGSCRACGARHWDWNAFPGFKSAAADFALGCFENDFEHSR